MTDPQTEPHESHDEGSRTGWMNPFRWPAGIWALVIAMLLMLTPFAIRAVMLAGVPAMEEPFGIAVFVKWDVPADQDAFTDYRRATELRRALGQIAIPENIDLVLEQGWGAADEPLQGWLQKHQESLAAWRRGTEQARGLNLPPASLTFASNLLTIQDQRLFVKLALLEQARCIDSGQFDDAWQWSRAALRSGGHSSYRGCLLQGLVGTAIHAISTNGVARWAEQPQVTAEQLKSALATVRSDYELYESPSNILKAEYLAVRNTFSSPDWVGALGPMYSFSSESQGVAAVMKMGYWVIGEPELAIRIFRQVLANQIREIDKPLRQRRKIVGTGGLILFDTDPAVPLLPGQLDAAQLDRAARRSILVRLAAPSLKQMDTAFIRQSARQIVVEVLLAIQAYRREHGEYPETLPQLVPAYLAAVPIDPCDPNGGVVLYRRDGNSKAVVWSVGDDGVDGGGNVESKNSKPPDLGFVIKMTE